VYRIIGNDLSPENYTGRNENAGASWIAALNAMALVTVQPLAPRLAGPPTERRIGSTAPAASVDFVGSYAAFSVGNTIRAPKWGRSTE
jgi:hypothetical protein